LQHPHCALLYTVISAARVAIGSAANRSANPPLKKKCLIIVMLEYSLNEKIRARRTAQ